MKVAFYTLGCRLNQLETEALASSFRGQGFFIVDWEEQAGIYIINTCTVTSKSEQKARRMVRKISRENPEVPVIVTGCYAQMERGSILDLGDNVVVVPLDDKDIIQDLAVYLSSQDSSTWLNASAHWMEEHLGLQGDKDKRFRFNPREFSFHSRAYLKVQDGCDNQCAYCRVTLARGASVSLDSGEILNRLRMMEEAGFREVVLTGVNIDSYRSNSLDLPGLLQFILDNTQGFRIRLSSLDPQTVTPELARVIQSPRICNYFHLSVQSGSDKILKSMNRHYDRRVVMESVSLLKKSKGNPFLAADIIVGFPGEQEEDFQRSMDLMIHSGFSRAHVFPYSSRPGTAAAEMTHPVASEIITQRAGELRKIMAQQQKQYSALQLGKTLNMLVEQVGETHVQGLSGNYQQCRILGYDQSMKKGQLVQVLVELVEKGLLICSVD